MLDVSVMTQQTADFHWDSCKLWAVSSDLPEVKGAVLRTQIVRENSYIKIILFIFLKKLMIVFSSFRLW